MTWKVWISCYEPGCWSKAEVHIQSIITVLDATTLTRKGVAYGFPRGMALEALHLIRSPATNLMQFAFNAKLLALIDLEDWLGQDLVGDNAKDWCKLHGTVGLIAIDSHRFQRKPLRIGGRLCSFFLNWLQYWYLFVFVWVVLVNSKVCFDNNRHLKESKAYSAIKPDAPFTTSALGDLSLSLTLQQPEKVTPVQLKIDKVNGERRVGQGRWSPII